MASVPVSAATRMISSTARYAETGPIPSPIRYDSSALERCRARRSSSENTATVAFPISLAARRTRIAISPRLATRIFANALTESLTPTPGGPEPRIPLDRAILTRLHLGPTRHPAVPTGGGPDDAQYGPGTMGLPSVKRSNRKRARSKPVGRPSTRSARTRPTPGPIPNPCPLMPVPMNRPSSAGASQM